MTKRNPHRVVRQGRAKRPVFCAKGGKGANQTINGLGGNDILYGDSFIMDHNAHGGNDTLRAINSGVSSHSVLYGDANTTPMR